MGNSIFAERTALINHTHVFNAMMTKSVPGVKFMISYIVQTVNFIIRS